MRALMLLALVLSCSLWIGLAEARTPLAPLQAAGNAAVQATVDQAPVPMGAVGSSCTFKGKKLYGKVQIVTSFPDIKVQVVTSFPDLNVKKVTSFPDSCGKWQLVTSFPDFKIQYVNSFPDVKIKFVESFPGVP